jgi:hypothetical protein
MHHVMKLSSLTLAAALAAGPVLAQQAGTTAPATHNSVATAPAAATAPSDRNPVLTDSGDVRASRVVGSSVYNDHNDKIGSVDDLVIGKDGKLTAVLSVGGFLGVGTRYVSVPYSSLKFGNTNAGSDNRVVLTGATKDSLKGMAEYHYTGSSRHS